MSEKVKVTKPQHDAIMKSFHAGHDRVEFVKVLANSRKGYWVASEKIMENLSTDDIIKGLYVGFEVELTPEEKILEQLYEDSEELRRLRRDDVMSKSNYVKRVQLAASIRTLVDVLKVLDVDYDETRVELG